MTPTVQIGRVAFREDLELSETTDVRGVRALALSGQESMPRHTSDSVVARRDDLAGLSGVFVPIVFSEKTYLDGFYLVEDSTAEIRDWDGIRVVAWKMSVLRVGTSQEIDIESRLSGAVTRSNNFAGVGERSHAAAIGHVGYWTGASSPTGVTRSSEDGNIVLYRGLPATVNPRWAIGPSDYGAGRVRFLDADDLERVGVQFATDPTDWTLTNGLVRVRPLAADGVLEVTSWTGGAWRSKNWEILVGTGPPATLAPMSLARVVRNQYECVTVRLMKGLAVGRATVDVTLRRGSRLAELYVQNEYATTTKIVLDTPEASTNTSGYVVATSNDGDGNRAIVGSAKTFVADVTNGGLSIAASTTLDALVGVVAGGGAAVAGDAAADLYAQYLGMPAELTQGVRR